MLSKITPLVLLPLSCLILSQCSPVRQIVAQPCDIVNSPREGNVKGYKRASYTIRGKRYHPMTVEAALEYKAEGVASHYSGGG